MNASETESQVPLHALHALLTVLTVKLYKAKNGYSDNSMYMSGTACQLKQLRFADEDRLGQDSKFQTRDLKWSGYNSLTTVPPD